MIRCTECNCFVPPRASSCPECDHAVSPLRRALMGVAMVGVSAATAMTLMACYGSPYDDIDCAGFGADNDSDGYCDSVDCNDFDFEIRPGAIDAEGDGIDQNCDGVDGNAPDAGMMSIDGG